MDSLNAIGTAATLMSVVLGGFAIWLSLTLYTRANDTERQTAVTLEAIKAQSEALQRLTGRWMDRFTKHATEPKPADEGLLTLVSTVASLPQTILSHLRVQPPAQQSQEALLQEIVDAYLALYYYAALTNVVAQALLPEEADFDLENAAHTTVQGIADRAAADFNHVAQLLNQVDRDRVNRSTLKHLLDEALASWQPHVQFTSQAFEARRPPRSE